MNGYSPRCTPTRALRRRLYHPSDHHMAETTDPSIFPRERVPGASASAASARDPLDDTLENVEPEPVPSSPWRGALMAVSLAGSGVLVVGALLLTSAVLAASVALTDAQPTIAATDAGAAAGHRPLRSLEGAPAAGAAAPAGAARDDRQ